MDEVNSLVGVLDNSTFKMFQTSEKTTAATVKVNSITRNSNERQFRRRSRNLIYNPTLVENKKSVICTNKIYLATTNNDKNFASKSFNSPLDRCD